MKTVTIYTDGACSGNPGPGGWGAILEFNGVEKEISGGEPSTTNNRMELTAVIRALQALKEPCIVELYSDSKYVIDALEKGWAMGWKKRGWVKSDKKPALNPDLWEVLLELSQKHTLHYHWVKGHATNPKNNRCDELAVSEWKKLRYGRKVYCRMDGSSCNCPAYGCQTSSHGGSRCHASGALLPERSPGQRRISDSGGQAPSGADAGGSGGGQALHCSVQR